MTAQLSRPIHSTSVGSETEGASHRAVFLHGLFGRGKNFSSIASGLLPEVQSLLVDLPNHGQSGWVDDVDYRLIADLVAEHVREGFAADGPVDVIGHSMGGKVAMVLALRHPELVRRLAVLDISPVGSGAARGEFHHLLGALSSLDLVSLQTRAEAGAALKEQIPNSVVRGFLLQNLKRGVGEHGETGFHWEPNLALLYSELETIMGFPETGAAEFSGPVLWVRGERSSYVTDADVPVMRALFPRTRRMMVRGAGHWVHSEKPAEIISALRAFLIAE